MPINCKNKCCLFEGTKKPCGYKVLELFLEGWKTCRECGYYILTDDTACKCCGGMFSTNPKTNSSRRKLQAMRQIVRM